LTLFLGQCVHLFNYVIYATDKQTIVVYVVQAYVNLTCLEKDKTGRYAEQSDVVLPFARWQNRSSNVHYRDTTIHQSRSDLSDVYVEKLYEYR